MPLHGEGRIVWRDVGAASQIGFGESHCTGLLQAFHRTKHSTFSRVAGRAGGASLRVLGALRGSAGQGASRPGLRLQNEPVERSCALGGQAPSEVC